MVKRIASATLWFLAVGWGFNLLGLITGTPPIMGLAVGIAAGAFVGLDPRHLSWPVRAPAAAARDALPVNGAMQTRV
jgi:hypothetical protein